MAAVKYSHTGRSPFHKHIFQESFISITRKSGGCFESRLKKVELSVPGGKGSLKNLNLWYSNAKKANLSARKKERIKLPNYGDGVGVGGNHISEFFSHPSGIEAILNTRALQSYQPLDSNLYRCVLPQIQLLSFRVAPVLDLQVTPSSEYCLVEMLSCKFQGSEAVERQNESFSASMRNHIKWESVDAEHVLDVDVELNLILEIHTQPFTLLPISAVEIPGNLPWWTSWYRCLHNNYCKITRNGFIKEPNSFSECNLYMCRWEIVIAMIARVEFEWRNGSKSNKA